VNNLTAEHKVNPIGIDATQPRFSWKISATGNNVMQTAYQIRVATNASFSSSSVVWNSVKWHLTNLFYRNTPAINLSRDSVTTASEGLG